MQAQGVPPVQDASMYPPGEDEEEYVPNTYGAGGRRKGPGVFGGGMSGGAAGLKSGKRGGGDLKKKGRGTFTF